MSAVKLSWTKPIISGNDHEVIYIHDDISGQKFIHLILLQSIVRCSCTVVQMNLNII